MDSSKDPTKPNPPSILAVDDTPANLELLCAMLKERGYRARPATSGALALQAARAEPPDLILLDIGMPEMDGYEVCARLKADPRLNEIPVIFLSAHTEATDKVKAFSVGGVDYVTKPFEFEEVDARVATHLEMNRKKRELERSYEKLAELERGRDAIAHMIIHDLRSPLSAIISFLSVLKSDADGMPEESRADIDECLAAAEKMNVLVSSVLDVSKMEDGAMTARPTACDLAAIVRDVLAEMRAVRADRRVVFEPAEASTPIFADRSLITRVVENLVNNAVKFTPRGGEIRIDLARSDDTVRFAITDQGPGVPRELQEKIFEKFGQIEAHARKVRHSSGLGLTFCKLAVERHGGRIGVESAEGTEGSTFWFMLSADEP